VILCARDEGRRIFANFAAHEKAKMSQRNPALGRGLATGLTRHCAKAVYTRTMKAISIGITKAYMLNSAMLHVRNMPSQRARRAVPDHAGRCLR
jgi:hypothetical protein